MMFRALGTPIFFLFLSNFLFAQHPKVEFTEEPSWVQTHQLSFDSLETGGTAGFYYLAADKQDFLGTEGYYRRIAYKILNSKGLQQMSGITVDFDPEYQTVKLHQVEIIRKGKVIDKLDWDNLQVIQRETGMEDYLYDGMLSIIANLPDVRIGDIIDYSYTITGDNPIHKGKYQCVFDLQFTFPVHFFRYMVYVPNDENIVYRKFNNAKDPKITRWDGNKIYEWKKQDLKAIIYEGNTPYWYNAAPHVQFSQFDSWGEIVSRYEKLYSLGPAKRRELKQKSSRFIEDGETKKDFITNTIRFVQDDIRYLGFENGLNSHAPTSPIKILDQRYGDCKDKSFLLCGILRSHDIEAYPVLVNSYNGKNLSGFLPSPNIFDHCVVRIDLGNGNHKYVDPTYGNQGGKLEGTYFPNYGYGLVIKPGEDELTSLPKPPALRMEIAQTFILDSIGGGGTMEIESVYWGANSDSQRQQFANTSIQALQKSYLQYYSELYPSIKVAEEMYYEDYREENKFKVVENYRIADFWNPSLINQDVIYFEFSPLVLSPFLYPVQSPTRKMPYHVGTKQDIVHKTIVYVPEAWNIEEESLDFGDENFHYAYDVRYKNAKLEITRKYESKKTFLAVGEVKGYLAEHAKAQETYSYMLTYNKKIGTIGEEKPYAWLSILLLLLIMGATGFVCYQIYARYDLPSKVEPKYQRKIGGWLVLVSIGLIITPFVLLSQTFVPEYYSGSIWTSLFSKDTWALGFFILALMVFQFAFFVFSIFVAVVFFKRRTIAPKMIIWFFGLNLAATAISTLIALGVFPEIYHGAFQQELIMDLVGAIIGASIWIPYFIYSERVEETFVNSKKKQSILEEGFAPTVKA